MVSAILATGVMQSTVTVFAAASLKDAFMEIGRNYEAKNPSVNVVFSFAGSQTLAAQIRQGAPADLFAAAAESHLRQSDPIASSIRVFARNRLCVVSRSGLATVKSLSDVRRLVVADGRVPAGSYALTFLSKAEKEYGAGWRRSVDARIVSREADVRSVLAKVKLGEADAGIVYYSDWYSERADLKVVGIPARMNVIATYPIGLTKRSENPRGAALFLGFLLTKPAQEVLMKHGFLEASAP